MNVVASNPLSTPSTASVVVGELLAGKYRVERLLGEGGMGVVVAAMNEALGQRVAIKLLRPGALVFVEAIGRFEREAKAVARLRSEHVARALDIGKLEDGRPYMVMEYLEGRDLGAVIDDPTPLSVWQAVDFVLQACEAVAEAHSAGIVHRDLKPKNLYLTTTVDGRPLVKVLDFGISKVEGSPQDLQLTRTTEIIGSPSYMSPEQLRSSRDVDSRTDIWALGVILYELLTKNLPFSASTVTELVAVVLMDAEKPIRASRPDVPEGLAYAIGRCLAKRPEERFQTVHELATALEAFGSGPNASAADRVRGVAQRLPGPVPSGHTMPLASPSSSGGFTPAPYPSSTPRSFGSPAGSSRVNVHGGTSVAWGETQVDPPRGARPTTKLPMVLAMVAAVALVAGVGGVAYMMKDDHGPRTAAAPTEGTPSIKTGPPPTSTIVAPTPSILISAPDDSAVPAPGSARPGTPAPPTTVKRPPGGGAAPPKAPDDPLSNIGRR